MKNISMGRRDFLRRSAAATLAAGMAGRVSVVAAQAPAAGPKKAVQFGMLPKGLSDAEKFKLVKACGFEGVEMSPMADLDAARKLGETANAAGVSLHSVCFGWWNKPMCKGDAAAIDKGLKDMEVALRTAQAMGGDAVLLVPGRVESDMPYGQVYEQTQKIIPKLIPLAQEMKVIIAVENVWNDFLLSPLEFARYVDEFNSPWVRAYFDVGNVVVFGWPQDWIRTLGKRIVKVHLKDFKKGPREWVNLRDGDVNWPEVRKAFDEVGYTGYLTTELPGGDEAYLKDLSGRVDQIIAGK